MYDNVKNNSKDKAFTISKLSKNVVFYVYSNFQCCPSIPNLNFHQNRDLYICVYLVVGVKTPCGRVNIFCTEVVDPN